MQAGGAGAFSDYYTAAYDHVLFQHSLADNVVFAQHNLVIDAPKSTGIALGVMPEGDFSAAAPVRLEPGDVAFLMTDGILEAHGTDGAVFGADRALEIVRANRTKTAKEIVHILCSSAREFCSYRTQVDDMTAIIIKAESAPNGC